MAKRRLIVTADDYGVSPIIDKAIEEAIQDKVITSVAAFANGPGYGGLSCVKRVKQLQESHPEISVGLHFTITSGKSVVGKSGKLTNRNGKFTGILRQHPEKALDGELEEELASQVKLFENAGIAITHFSDHQGILSATTKGLRVMIDTVKAYNNRTNRKSSLRNPVLISSVINDPNHCMDRSRLAARARAGAKIRNLFRRHAFSLIHFEYERMKHHLREIHKNGLPTTDYFIESLYGSPRPSTLKCILNHAPSKPYHIRQPTHRDEVSSEIIVHLAKVPNVPSTNARFKKKIRQIQRFGGINVGYIKRARRLELQVLQSYLSTFSVEPSEIQPF